MKKILFCLMLSSASLHSMEYFKSWFTSKPDIETVKKALQTQVITKTLKKTFIIKNGDDSFEIPMEYIDILPKDVRVRFMEKNVLDLAKFEDHKIKNSSILLLTRIAPLAAHLMMAKKFKYEKAKKEVLQKASQQFSKLDLSPEDWDNFEELIRLLKVDGNLVAKILKDVNLPLLDLHALRHNDRVNSAGFSPDGTKVVTASDDETAKTWDVITGKELHTLQDKMELTSARFSPDGTKIVTNSVSYDTRIWDASNGKNIYTLEDTSEAVFSPDGARIATIFSTHPVEASVIIRNVTNGKELLALQEMDRMYQFVDVNFSPDGARIATASFTNILSSSYKTAEIWDSNNGKELLTLEGDLPAKKVIFSPNNTQIASDYGRSVKIWDAMNGKWLYTIYDNGKPVFSPDGTKIVTAFDQAARIWDALNGKLLHTLQHNDFVTSVAFSPNGIKVITTSSDNTAKIWDVATGKELNTLQHNDRVNSAGFSPDGTKVVTASNDHTAKIWGNRFQKLADEQTSEKELVKKIHEELPKKATEFAVKGGKSLEKLEVEQGKKVKEQFHEQQYTSVVENIKEKLKQEKEKLERIKQLEKEPTELIREEREKLMKPQELAQQKKEQRLKRSKEALKEEEKEQEIYQQSLKHQQQVELTKQTKQELQKELPEKVKEFAEKKTKGIEQLEEQQTKKIKEAFLQEKKEEELKKIKTEKKEQAKFGTIIFKNGNSSFKIPARDLTISSMIEKMLHAPMITQEQIEFEKTGNRTIDLGELFKDEPFDDNSLKLLEMLVPYAYQFTQAHDQQSKTNILEQAFEKLANIDLATIDWFDFERLVDYLQIDNKLIAGIFLGIDPKKIDLTIPQAGLWRLLNRVKNSGDILILNPELRDIYKNMPEHLQSRYKNNIQYGE